MRILAGLELGGATLTPFDNLGLGRGVIGEVVWGPRQLLRDLELRLGLGIDEEPNALRAAKWAERIARVAPHGRFYTRSFDMDPLGTARALLALRDLLIAAAWAGQPITDGGPRLDAIRELEALNAPALPLGFADRVVAVRRALADCRIRHYTQLTLAEPVELWETSWQAVFAALERAGTRLSTESVALPGAQPDTDLGQVQTALEIGVSTPTVFRGDGSFVLMTAETSWEAARATAAILAGLPAERSVVIREGDVSALDNALSVQGLGTQGWRSTSPWRAALQVLPLALELAFEPKDPYRVLELLTLPVGPFQGLPGHRLARALAESPGIGSPAWEVTKAELAQLNDSPELLVRINEWLEQRGAESVPGAPKADILAVIARVRAWIVARVPSTPDDVTLLAAARQAGALRAALESDPRTTFSLVEVRRLAEAIAASGTTVQLSQERAGRIDHVEAAGGLRVPRNVVLWWAFAESENTHRALPWRRQELLALAAAGIHFPDPRARLAERANGWRRAILAATGRVILVMPRTCYGATLAPHPLWDEIVGRTGTDGARALLRRITVSASDLLTQPSTQSPLDVPQLEALEAAPLPGGHPDWVVPREHLSPIERWSNTSLNALLSCPLKWALRYRAGLRGGGHALPPLVKLSGTLGGRLVELLYAQGAFDLDDAALENRAESQLDELFRREGAVLLRTGMGFERSQLRRQLVRSMLALARTLRAAGLRILDVEKRIDVSWRGAKLEGRIDLLVATESGDHAIIDVKWGISSYRELLRSGQALQLAAYAFAHATERADRRMPDAAYFSLSRAACSD
jgi:ATP-dependent helicase/nuclease subunit B